MNNSFTFKNPMKVQCYADGDLHIMLVMYKHWHWAYEYTNKKLDVYFPVPETKWSKNIAVTDFKVEVQTPIYFKDHRTSVRYKPVYEKSQINWDDVAVHALPVTVRFNNGHFNIEYKQSVDQLYGDDILTIVESMRGFFTEFREYLKKRTVQTIDDFDAILSEMNCRLCNIYVSNSNLQKVRDEKVTKRYGKLQETNEIKNEEVDYMLDGLPF